MPDGRPIPCVEEEGDCSAHGQSEHGIGGRSLKGYLAGVRHIERLFIIVIVRQ